MFNPASIDCMIIILRNKTSTRMELVLFTFLD